MTHLNASIIMLVCVCVSVCRLDLLPLIFAVAMAAGNPQTQEFCEKLGILNPFVPPG